MRFSVPLIPATLIRRYKRFLADVRLPSGEEITVHVANSGGMIGLAAPGAPVWLSKSANEKRKLAHSWELVECDFGGGPELVGVDTGHPNLIVAEAVAAGEIPELAGYATLRREVPYGKNSRVDLLLGDPVRAPCYVEVKNVHLMRRPGLAEFPRRRDGARHQAPGRTRRHGGGRGARAVMFYLIQIGSADRFALAADIDPVYARTFVRARAAGVEALAYVCAVGAGEIRLARRVPFA